MSALVDTSALVSLFLADAHAARARHALAGEGLPVVSSLAIAEYASAVGIRVRSRAISTEGAAQALSLFDLWVATGSDTTEVIDADHRLAGLFVRRFELALRVPDALHLAIAHRLGLPLLTFDIRQAAAATSLGIACAPAGATGAA